MVFPTTGTGTFLSMKRTRTKNKKPDFIITGDWHLRDDIPICRIDDYQKAQWCAMDFIADLQSKYHCPVLQPGDVLHRWKPSPWLLSQALLHMPSIYAVAGNHDLPKHQIDLLYKSGFETLKLANKISCHKMVEKGKAIIYGFPYGQKLVNHKHKEGYRNIAVAHTMVWKKDLPYPGCTAGDAKSLLKKMESYSVVITGDNHEAFVEEYEGRLLVNCGSLMRMTAAQVDHKPRVYLYYIEDNTIEEVLIPIEEGVISREHLDIEEERSERISAFVSRLDDDWDVGLDFPKNMEEFFGKNEVKKSVKNLVWECVE